MSVKLAQLKQRVIKTLVKSGALVVTALVVAGTVGYISDEMSSEAQRLSNEVMSLNQQVISLEDKIKRWGQLAPKYNDLVGPDGTGQQLQRTKAQELLESIQKQLGLSEVAVSLSPPKELTGEFDRPKAVSVTIDMDIKADAFLDTDAIVFFREMQNRLPGQVRVTKMNLQASKLSAELVRNAAVSGKGLPVKLAATVQWYGIREKEKALVKAPASGAAAVPTGGDAPAPSTAPPSGGGR